MALDRQRAPKQLEDRLRDEFKGAMNRFLYAQRNVLSPDEYRELMGFFDATVDAMEHEDLKGFEETRRQWIPKVHELMAQMVDPTLASALFARSGGWKEQVTQKLKDQGRL